MIRRINLFSGPGCGKSTLAAWLFAELKMQGLNVEHVIEYVKAWTFIGRPPQSFDQIYIFGKQLHREDIVLRSCNDVVIVSESPIMLTSCYAKKYGAPGWAHLIALCQEFETRFPSLNFFVSRGDCPYRTNGRFQNYEEALEMDRDIKEILLENNVTFEDIKYRDNHLLLEKCQKALGIEI